MTASVECKMHSEKRKVRRWGVPLFILNFALFTGAGCQQKMAEQPYYRPYEPSKFFADGRSNRPLEPGTIHRAQRLEFDPQVTGLTRQEWDREYALGAIAARPAITKDGTNPLIDVAPKKDTDRTKAIGAPRYAPAGVKLNPADGGFTGTGPTGGQPVQIYATEFPFEMTTTDLRRGAERFTVFCAECHGPMGNGKGKIWERGYLKPTSYHTEPVDAAEPAVKRDAQGNVIPRELWAKTPGRFYDTGPGSGPGNDIPLGYSRGYWRWGIRIPVREVPPGYIFEVITRGYGAMGDYAAQIKPADRWRIAAYVRVLQHSQHFDVSQDGTSLPAEGKEKLGLPKQAPEPPKGKQP